MKLLKLVIDWFKSAIDLNPVKTLFIRGYLNPSSVLETFLNNLDKTARFKRVYSTSSLSECFQSDKHILMVVLCCQGEPRGFLCETSETNCSKTYIPEKWWQNEFDFEVYLFAYSCHSYTYISLSNLSKLLMGSIGFDGELSFWTGSKSGKFFWIRFFYKLQTSLKHIEAINLVTVSEIRQVYLDYLKKEGKRIESNKQISERAEMWLNLACLNRQMEILGYIPGGRSWIDIKKL